jgi:hypothetical protein
MDCLNAMRGAIATAERVVLLGFAFHPQNMSLMTAPNQAETKNTYATAYGIPPSNADPIRVQLIQLVALNHVPVVDFSTCNDFFRNQWYHLIQ